jgi:hypothetical protein
MLQLIRNLVPLVFMVTPYGFAGVGDLSAPPSAAPVRPALSRAAAPATSVPLQPSGALIVQTLPPAAGIWLDGSYIGVSPLDLGAIPAGRHTITLTKSGWRTTEFPVSLPAGASLTEMHRLDALPPAKYRRYGEVSLHQPRDLREVRVDGEPVGPHPADAAVMGEMRLPVGRHIVSAFVNGVLVRREFLVVADLPTELILDAQAPDTAARLVEPADTALPAGALVLQGRKIVITVGPHRAVGHLDDPQMRVDGRVFILDPPPVMAGAHLYLPVTFVDQLLHL